MFLLQVRRHVSVNINKTILFSICWRDHLYAVPSFYVGETAKCICTCAILRNARHKTEKHFLLLQSLNFTYHDDLKNVPFISKVKWSVAYFILKCCAFFFSFSRFMIVIFLFYNLLLGKLSSTFIYNKRKRLHFFAL